MDYWKIQDIFHERMKMDYENGVISNPTFKPYFEWKFHNAPIKSLTKQMCYDIMNEAQKELDALDKKYPSAHEKLLAEPTLDDVWKPYKGYEDDCYLYSYLIAIESETLKILINNYG